MMGGQYTEVAANPNQRRRIQYPELIIQSIQHKAQLMVVVLDLWVAVDLVI